MTVYVAEAHAHVHRLVSVFKMATVLEAVLPKSSVLLCVFCGQTDSMQRIFINKCFLLTVVSVCRVKGFTTGSRNVANVSLMKKRLKWRCGSDRSKSEDVMLRVRSDMRISFGGGYVEK
jgi:hypothetical protein